MTALEAYADALGRLARRRAAMDAAEAAGDDERAAVLAEELPAFEAAVDAARRAARAAAAQPVTEARENGPR